MPLPSRSPHQSPRVPAPSVYLPCLLPASLPPQVPASPDPLRYLRYATQSATTLFNTLQVTATLVGRNPPPGPGHPPPQSRQPTPTWVSLYTQAASLLQPPRVIFLSAPSFCLVLPCHPPPRRDIAPVPVSAASISQYRTCHVRHNVLSLSHPLFSFPLGAPLRSSTYQPVPRERAIDGTCQITGSNFIVETLFSDSLAAVHDSGAIIYSRPIRSDLIQNQSSPLQCTAPQFGYPHCLLPTAHLDSTQIHPTAFASANYNILPRPQEPSIYTCPPTFPL